MTMSESCLDIRIGRVGDALSFDPSRVGRILTFGAERRGPVLAFSAHREGVKLDAVVSRDGRPLEFRCGLVCTVGAAAYLNVEPETLWLIPDNNFSTEVVVYANVRWRIE